MTDTRPTAKAQAEQLTHEMQRGKKVHDFFSKSLENELMVSGHPLSHWKDEFFVHIPGQDLTPKGCRELDLKVMRLSQEAQFYYNLALAKSQMIKHGNEAIFTNKFHSLVHEYKNAGKRLPAQGTLEHLAKQEIKEIHSAQQIADYEVSFWKGILAGLGRCQSQLKNVSMMISTEMKYMDQDRLADAAERNRNNV